MALLQDLIQQIDDPALRERIMQETNKLVKQKKFGLVFEDHLPECTPLYDAPIRVGSKVSLKSGKVDDFYVVQKIDGEEALCDHRETHEKKTFALNELVAIAEFGEPIYPTLKPIDYVENAPDSGLWHALIEADNYHALQMLEYLYTGKVDCIYIDPPYNTGARDWKYNNDYVDGNDAYRHSKWLSFMEKRLKLAKKLLNPSTGVLIVTIDEHEVHHLGTLLEEVFPECYVQMATIVINQKGVSQGRLARTEEYALFVFMPNAFLPVHFDDLLSQDESAKTQVKPRWERLLRGGTDSRREDSPTLFYPVYVDPETKRITGVGEIVPVGTEPDLSDIDNKTVAWPIRTDGTFGRWQVSPPSFKELIDKGYAKLGTWDKKRKTWTVLYLNRGSRKRIDDGEIVITGKDPITGVLNVEFANDEARLRNIKTVWHRRLHDSGVYGSTLLSNIIGRDVKFDFPKSIYSTKDAIAAVVRNQPQALIVDFFAGSGTTLNAVNLLNADDGGERRCILVTNNEVSEVDLKQLKNLGFQAGDSEWEAHGIAQSVTWPRTKYSINGRRDDGTILSGDYFTILTKDVTYSRSFTKIDFVSLNEIDTPEKKKQLVSLLGKSKLPQSLVKADSKFIVSDKYSVSILFDDSSVNEWVEALSEQDHVREFYIITQNNSLFNVAKERVVELLGDYVVQEQLKRPISDGFHANAVFFKLSFLDKTSIALGRQFKELLPVLWMKGGAVGKCPVLDTEDLLDMLILPENKMAVLVDEIYYPEFDEKLAERPEINTVFIVTDSENAYREMIQTYYGKECYQLYRDYLDNFRINIGR